MAVLDMSLPDRTYNGVFKGGGAKGIAYAGALQACEDQEIEFAEVAGSSAGAITATLVACGYTAGEIADRMPSALAAMGSLRGSMGLVGRRSLLSNRRLRAWLALVIAERIRPGFDGEPPDCTFNDIKKVTDIELYVVALDLATRQPVVFSSGLTPDMTVADAVIASSAIPVAFPASRMMVGAEVHRFVDGGTWANYPSFVFLDPDFRSCHGLGTTPRHTIGFILDDAPLPGSEDITKISPANGRRRLSDRGSVVDQFGLLGAVLSSWVFRSIAALVPALFVWLSLSWLGTELKDLAPNIGELHKSVQDPALVALVAVFSTAGLVAILLAFVLVRFGGSLLDTGLVGAAAAMGVGPSVPYWIGADNLMNPHHTAVRIVVPPALTTLRFNPNDDLRVATVEAGRQAAQQALDSMLGGGQSRPQPSPHPRPHVSTSDDEPPTDSVENHYMLRFIGLMYVMVAGVAAAFGLLRGFSNGASHWTVPFLLAFVASTVVLGVWITAQSRLHRVRQPYAVFGRWSNRRLVPIVLIGLLGAGGFAALQYYDAVSTVSVLRTDEMMGEVERTIPDVSLDGFVMDEVYVNLPEASLLTASGSLAGLSFNDGSNEPVLPCETSSTTCLRFRTSDSSFDDGEQVTVRYNIDQSLVLLDASIWTFDRVAAGSWSVVLTLFFGTAAVRALGAIGWRRKVAKPVQQASRSSGP